MMRSKTVAVVIALAAFGVLATPADAHQRVVLDGDDTSGPFDMVAVRMNHLYVGETHPERTWRILEFRLITYGTWTNDALTGIDTHITFEFDLDKDEDVDRCLVIQRSADGRLEGQMYSVGCEFVLGKPVGKPQDVRRRDEHSLEIDFRPRLLGEDVTTFRWRAVTSYDREGDSECPQPDPLPPERRYATCTDFTRWQGHSI